MEVPVPRAGVEWTVVVFLEGVHLPLNVLTAASRV